MRHPSPDTALAWYLAAWAIVAAVALFAYGCRVIVLSPPCHCP